jgi:hypothetical protein
MKGHDVKVTKFLPSLAEVPSKELEALKERAIRSGTGFIDFRAVDFDWHLVKALRDSLPPACYEQVPVTPEIRGLSAAYIAAGIVGRS